MSTLRIGRSQHFSLLDRCLLQKTSDPNLTNTYLNTKHIRPLKISKGKDACTILRTCT